MANPVHHGLNRDQLSNKMDTRFEQTDRKIDSLASNIDELKRPA
jgi:hypothetical protein